MLRTNPDKFWTFSKALFDKQTEYFDEALINLPRNKTYEKLAKLAGGVGLDEKQIYSLLEISSKGASKNAGNEVTDDIKLMVKVRSHPVGCHMRELTPCRSTVLPGCTSRRLCYST